MRLMMQKPKRPAMEPCIWGRMAPPVASAGFELVALACEVASAVAVDCARGVSAGMSWSSAVVVRKDVPAVSVEEWFDAPAAEWSECDEATTVALLLDAGCSELPWTPTAVATGSEDGEETRSRDVGVEPSPEPGMPALTAMARLAATKNCETRMVWCVG